MGGLVIEEIRPGVAFIPPAASAFRRANAQVRAELGRDIDVNSTYRSRSTQLAMYHAWQAYASGRGPYPGHSKALHPDDPLAFHVAGTALDSDDWRVQRIVAILAENGFIRNRLYVKNEEHHFEWIRDRDHHYGEPIPTGGATAPANIARPESKEDDMPRNTGVTYRSPASGPESQARWIALIHNTGSGFELEVDNGRGGGKFDGAITTGLAVAYDTPSWAEVSEGAAANIKRGLAAVRAAKS